MRRNMIDDFVIQQSLQDFGNNGKQRNGSIVHDIRSVSRLENGNNHVDSPLSWNPAWGDGD